MKKKLKYKESTLRKLGGGYYLVIKRFTREWTQEGMTDAEVEQLRECLHDFDGIFQFHIELMFVSEGMSFRAEEYSGVQENDSKNYGRQLVLLVKREAGIPGEEETARRLYLLQEREQKRYMEKEKAKGRKGKSFRGCKAYTGEELADLGVFMHRLALRLSLRWLELHGGVRKRVFYASYQSFLIDEECLRQFGVLARKKTGDKNQDNKREPPRLYVECGVMGTKKFHQMIRGLGKKELEHLDNLRNRICRELFVVFFERVQEQSLKEEVGKLLSRWFDGVKEALSNPLLFLPTRMGMARQEAERELLMQVLVGFGYFGWCLSEAVVRRVYRRWLRSHVGKQGGHGAG
ncbi:MAG: hypothetical protein IJJ26_07550 [Victivallales bacterium]|nr:hypothetical protein [Victivallales bacterium]